MGAWFDTCVCLAILSVTLLLIQSAEAKKPKVVDEETCEVCVKFMRKVTNSLDQSRISDAKYVEKEFRKLCKTAKKDDNRFCYYVGATEDSATSIVGEVVGPLTWSMPAEKICMKLSKKDEQICELKYDKEIDLSTVDLKALKVKDLKKILGDWEEQCRGCTEKSDYINRIEELMPIHAPGSVPKKEL